MENGNLLDQQSTVYLTFYTPAVQDTRLPERRGYPQKCFLSEQLCIGSIGRVEVHALHHAERARRLQNHESRQPYRAGVSSRNPDRCESVPLSSKVVIRCRRRRDLRQIDRLCSCVLPLSNRQSSAAALYNLCRRARALDPYLVAGSACSWGLREASRPLRSWLHIYGAATGKKESQSILTTRRVLGQQRHQGNGMAFVTSNPSPYVKLLLFASFFCMSC